MLYLFLFILIFLLINEILLKKNILIDNLSFSKHKKLTSNNNNLPITGGYILIFFFLFFGNDFNLSSKILFLIIFLSGALSDQLKNFSPNIRLIMHILISSMFIMENKILIIDTRILFINNILTNYEYVSILFTVFCLIVLINGSNFIDGVNLNTIGYFAMVYAFIIYLSTSSNFIVNIDFLLNFLITLIFLLILNSLDKTLLGDGGAYLLGFFTAIYLIGWSNSNNSISPYFIILLLWYPCFENLFSIIRKKYQNKKITTADNLHLHQLIFIFLKKKKCYNTNNLSGLIICFFNLPTFILGTIFYDKTKILLSIIVINILLYVYIYNKLIIYLKNNNLFQKKSIES